MFIMIHNILMWFSKASLQDSQQFILLTYRSGIISVSPTTYYTSDSGWGCMLRVVQMAAANLLLKCEHQPLPQILPLFFDNSLNQFSIQSLTKLSSAMLPHKAAYEWFSPCQAGHLLKNVLQSHFDYSVSICNDNCLFLSEVCLTRPKVLIMLMTRIGLDSPQEGYLETTTCMMRSKHFLCIMGGTPKHAHLFLKVSPDGKYFGYLDPHRTWDAEFTLADMVDNSQKYISRLEWVKKNKIDCSMCVVFRLHRDQIQFFWKEMLDIKMRNNNGFHIYMDLIKPVYSNQDLIQFIQE